MYLSLATWSFPSLRLTEAVGVAKAIGMAAVDVSTRYRPGLDKSELLHDPLACAVRVRALELPVSNYFHHFGADVMDRNLALAASRDANARDLENVLAFADAAGIASVFVLPGRINPGQSQREALDAAAESLALLQAVAEGFKARLCIEPAVGSVAETPEAARELVERTGVALALDYSHFACLGYMQAQIDPLIPYAVHMHLRQARAGSLQTPFDKGVLNFPALFGALRDVGYKGALAIEFIRQVFTNDRPDDVMSETIAMRDCFNTWMAAAPSETIED